ncbi:MAG: hypothetical protein JNK15_00700 [Planctomycetes bacterium]|nr:hypothetical protein [Planctomycetota bacterium]
MIHLRFTAGALALATVLPAQTTLTDGNTTMTLAALSATSQSPTTFDLRGDALAVDHGFEHHWYYRLAGDPREFAFRSLGGVTGGVTPSNDHGDRDLADVDSRGLLKASFDYDVYDSGPASGVLISRVTVMNISAAPVTLDMFCYTDLDLTGSAGDDIVTGDNSRHFVTDPTGVQIEVRALGNDLSQVAPYPQVRTLLTNAAVNNLAGVLPPFTGDYTGAFQWQGRTLLPFEQKTFQVVFAIDTAATLVPIVENYGYGNGSTFEIHTQTAPLQDNTQPRVLNVQMKGALPNVEQRTIVGLAPWLPPLPFIPGLEIWCEPIQIIGVFAGYTSATGEAQESFVIPAGPYLTGLNAFFQVFTVDAAAPNGYAYFTPGMRVRIGKL